MHALKPWEPEIYIHMHLVFDLLTFISVHFLCLVNVLLFFYIIQVKLAMLLYCLIAILLILVSGHVYANAFLISAYIL